MRRCAVFLRTTLFAVVGALALLASSAMADVKWTAFSRNEFVSETAQRHPRSTTVLLTIPREDGARFDDQVALDLKHTYLHRRSETRTRTHLTRRAKVRATVDILRDGERLQRTKLKGKTGLTVFHRSLCDFLSELLKPGDVVSVRFKFTKWPSLEIGDVVDSRVSLVPQGCHNLQECSGKPLVVSYKFSHRIDSDRVNTHFEGTEVLLRGEELVIQQELVHGPWGNSSGDLSGPCSSSANIVLCEVSCEGAVRAYNHDCVSGSSVGVYGDFVTEGCSTAEDAGFVIDCCLE